MKNLVLCALAFLTISTSLLPSGVAQSPNRTLKTNRATTLRSDLDTAIHDYLIAHPEVVLESVRAFDAHQKQVAAERIRDNVRSHLAELTGETSSRNGSATVSAGVTVVECFDYRCGFCKKVAPTVLGLTGSEGVHIVY